METKATSKGRITLPSKLRKELGIKDGTVLHVDVNETRQIILTPVTREFVRSLRGKYKGKGLMKAWMAVTVPILVNCFQAPEKWEVRTLLGDISLTISLLNLSLPPEIR